MTLLLAVLGVVGVVLFASGRRLQQRCFLLGAAPLVGVLVWTAVQLPGVLDGDAVDQHVEWVPQLGLGLDLRLDAFAAVMVLLVAGIGVLVMGYASVYFAPKPGRSGVDGDRLGRYAGLLVLFAGAMLCVVLADNLLVLYTGWELTGVTSYLLIGNDHTKTHARAAALQALLVTSAGGLAMLAGFVLIGQAAGTFRLSTILASPPSGTTVDVALVLVLIGAFTKSAQYPFHSWLPGAMVAPTPVSAYLHSATMVKAGVYLIARFAPAFAAAGVWRPLVITVGAFTMIAGGLRALRQTDLKLLLAFGTVSQLGFLVVLFGIGSPAATEAGVVMLIAHALFKAGLFMVVGALDKLTGTRDLGELPSLPGRRWALLRGAAIACAGSMAGVPLLVGFIGKEAGFEAISHAPLKASGLALAGVVAGSVLTAAYTARFVWGMCASPAARRATSASSTPSRALAGGPGADLLVPMGVLALVGVVVGVAPALADRLAGASVRSLGATGFAAHLAIWHGANLALLLSAVALGGGAILFLLRDRVAPVLATGSRIPSGSRVYVAILRGTNSVANVATGVIQNGSLPIYAGVTLLTAMLAPAIVLLSAAVWPGWPDAVDGWAQIPIVVAVLAAALAAAATRRRFSAALFLGTTGYAMAGLFVVQGAPDLALTQVAIETLSTVLFVLVLRRLPDRFERRSTTRRRVVRVIISAVVGITVFCFAIIASGSREVEPVSTEMIERSLPDGHGRNVVNVILVDIRGFDTLGEVTVLASAAIGAVALARAGNRRRRDGAT